METKYQSEELYLLAELDSANCFRASTMNPRWLTSILLICSIRACPWPSLLSSSWKKWLLCKCKQRIEPRFACTCSEVLSSTSASIVFPLIFDSSASSPSTSSRLNATRFWAVAGKLSPKKRNHGCVDFTSFFIKSVPGILLVLGPENCMSSEPPSSLTSLWRDNITFEPEEGVAVGVAFVSEEEELVCLEGDPALCLPPLKTWFAWSGCLANSNLTLLALSLSVV